jgi:hypothetical protein
MRYNYTPLSMIGFLNENYKGDKLKNPAILLNDGKLQTGYGYGYYQNNKGERGKKSPTSIKKPENV